jgi:hypothetical protein
MAKAASIPPHPEEDPYRSLRNVIGIVPPNDLQVPDIGDRHGDGRRKIDTHITAWPVRAVEWPIGPRLQLASTRVRARFTAWIPEGVPRRAGIPRLGVARPGDRVGLAEWAGGGLRSRSIARTAAAGLTCQAVAQSAGGALRHAEHLGCHQHDAGRYPEEVIHGHEQSPRRRSDSNILNSAPTSPLES